MIHPVVKEAMLHSICDVGTNLSDKERRQLNQAVKRGWLKKGKGGPYPALKTVYCLPTRDIDKMREAQIAELLRY